MKKNNLRLAITSALVIITIATYAQASFPTITVNLNYPQFQKLKLDGGFVYMEGGLKGLILYRSNENLYLAFERACPHHPQAGCAIVQVDASTLFMVDHCCNSSFNFSDGYPTGGPAERPLIQYRVDQDGQVLKVSDEIIN